VLSYPREKIIGKDWFVAAPSATHASLSQKVQIALLALCREQDLK